MLQQLNILVAEDNPLNQRITNFILQKYQASVANAVNGLEAIDHLNRQEFDIVLMDLQMPEMDGYEATKYIRESLKNDIPIVAVTASVSDKEMQQTVDVGMNGYISKPLDPETLCKIILGLVKTK